MALKVLFLGEPGSPNTMTWVEGMRKLGCEVNIASARWEGHEGVYPIGPSYLPGRMRILFGKTDLKKLILNLSPDVVIGYRITSYGYLASMSGFKPVVLAAQNEKIVSVHYSGSPIKRKIIEHFARTAIRKADLIHAWGDNVADGLREYGASEDQILTMHRGIDTTVFSDASSKSFEISKPVFISTRSLYPIYEVPRIVKGFRKVVDKIPEARLEIVGNGSERELLENLVSKLKLQKNINFRGRLNRVELTTILEQADFYISMVQTEGISSSLLEAMAAKVLPIVADIPASRILVKDSVNGLLVSKLSVDTIAETMLKGIVHYTRLAEELSSNQKKIFNDFDRAKNLSKFIEEYKKLIQ